MTDTDMDGSLFKRDLHRSTDGGSADDRGRTAGTPSEIPAAGWKDIGIRVKDQIEADQVQVVAAGLAFYAMLAIFPAMIAFIAIYGLVADPADVSRQIASLSETLPAEAATLIEEQLAAIVSDSPQALGWTAAIAIVGALWSASSGAQQLVKAINRTYDQPETRGFLALRGLALAVTFGFVLLAALSLGLIVVVPPIVQGLEWGTAVEWAVSIGGFVLLAAVLILALGFVYRLAPDRDDAEVRWVTWGAAIATLVWVIASVLFSVAVSNFGNFQETYGTLAGVIVLLLWFFLSAFIVLLGAEINSEIEAQTRVDTTTGEAQVD